MLWNLRRSVPGIRRSPVRRNWAPAPSEAMEVRMLLTATAAPPADDVSTPSAGSTTALPISAPEISRTDIKRFRFTDEVPDGYEVNDFQPNELGPDVPVLTGGGDGDRPLAPRTPYQPVPPETLTPEPDPMFPDLGGFTPVPTRPITPEPDPMFPEPGLGFVPVPIAPASPDGTRLPEPELDPLSPIPDPEFTPIPGGPPIYIGEPPPPAPAPPETAPGTTSPTLAPEFTPVPSSPSEPSVGGDLPQVEQGESEAGPFLPALPED